MFLPNIPGAMFIPESRVDYKNFWIPLKNLDKTCILFIKFTVIGFKFGICFVLNQNTYSYVSNKSTYYFQEKKIHPTCWFFCNKLKFALNWDVHATIPVYLTLIGMREGTFHPLSFYQKFPNFAKFIEFYKLINFPRWH